MKKFVSMAMVAAMTTSMVPATAFAGVGEVEATAKIVDAWTMTEDFDGNVVDDKDSVPELQIKITDTNYKQTTIASEDYYAEITVALDNAELDDSFTTDNIKVILGSEAKEELNADIAGSDAAVKAAEAKIKAAKKALYGDEDFDVEEDGPVEDIEDEETLYGKLNAAKEKLDAAVTVDDEKMAEAVAKDAAVIAATEALYGKEGTEEEPKEGSLVDAVAKAEEALEEAEIAAVVAQDKADKLAADVESGTVSFKVGETEYVDQVVADLEADLAEDEDDGNDTTYETYLKAKQALAEDDGTDEEETAELKEALATAAKDLQDAKDLYAEATKALETLKTDARTAKTDAKTAANAVTAAQTKVETAAGAVTDKEAELAAAVAKAEAAYKETAAGEDAAEEAAAVKAAQEAVDAKEAELKAAEEAKAKAEAAAGEAGETMATDFEVVAVEGISNGKTKAAIKDADEFTFGIKGKLHAGDVISIDLATVMDKTSIGKAATLDVESGDLNLDVADLVYVAVEDYGITATVKKLANVAEEEKAYLEKDLKIESVVGDFAKGQEIELKLNNGFEFDALEPGDDYSVVEVDDNEAIIKVENAVDEITIKAEDMYIEATSAKSGDVATITVKAKDTKNVTGAFAATAKVEVMKVVDYTVMLSVDEDEDLPLIYSGVNVDNDHITDDSDHLSLEVTVEESFPGAWSMRKGFNFELPDGVYVTNVELKEHDALYINADKATSKDVTDAFEKAYQDGDHKNFEFEKRVFNDVDNKLDEDCATMTFQLELVADPTFAGDVTLKFTGDLVDEQEVTIAKFMPIAVVEAEQNDMKIDYRYTEIPTAITITETAAGLWEEGSEFWMAIDKDDVIEFEDGATFEATNGLEIDDFEDDRFSKSADEDVNSIGFKVEEESDEAATVTISNMSLFMQRNIPAGAYDLTAGADAFADYLAQGLYAADTCKDSDHPTDCDCDRVIADVEDFSDVVKEAFVNVVTAGREQDDASFTTKVVVPVGESYIVAGENQVTLDVPAYVSAAGYTMLPVRAVATALGINNNNVIWNGETKTVTILYGQRIITMVAGQKVVNVNGSVIPASAAVEIVDGRTFLPMRDLATALGVTDITWDAATKTATLNGGVVAE